MTENNGDGELYQGVPVDPGPLEKTPEQVLEEHTTHGEPTPPEDTNLYQHALRELQAAGIQPEDQEKVLAIVREFASWHCSGGEASWYIHVIIRLLQYENLSALTDNPDEWNKVSDDESGMWQCARNPEAFSTDGGKTYYLLSENQGNVRNPHVTHTSNDHTKRMG